MALSRSQLQSWALRMIDAAYPPSEAITAIDDLARVSYFFEAGGATLFGMKASPDAFEDPAVLVARAKAGLLAWFEHFGETGDEEQQARLYHHVAALFPDVPEPTRVRERREAVEAFEAAKRSALGALPRPLEAVSAVSPELADELRQLGRDGGLLRQHGGLLGAEGDGSLAPTNFEWLNADPEWDDLVDAAFDGPFFPVAGADGDYIGVLVVPGEAPVVYFSHEEGFFFVAQSLRCWEAMCVEAKKAGRDRRRRVDRVRRASGNRELDASALASSSNAYSARLAEANAITQRLRRDLGSS